MLRISAGLDAGHPVLKLEGRLTDPWVREADTHWATATSTGVVPTVDLRDVLSVDAAGRQLLARMRQDGATFVVAGCVMRALLAELHDGHEGEALPVSGGAAAGVDWKGRVG